MLQSKEVRVHERIIVTRFRRTSFQNRKLGKKLFVTISPQRTNAKPKMKLKKTISTLDT